MKIVRSTAQMKCAECNNYLSYEPVVLKQDGQSICGRCPAAQQESVTRNGVYEQLAALLVFPCANERHGCTMNISFLQQKPHEDQCMFRLHGCPLGSVDGCRWRGLFTAIVDHCGVGHPDSVIDNGWFLRCMLTRSRSSMYLVPGAHMFFLVHVKVCLDTRQVFHGVQRVGRGSDPEDKFTYDLETSMGVYEGTVYSADRYVLDEGQATVTGVDDLLREFRGLGEAVFRVTLKRSMREPKCRRCLEAQRNSLRWCRECAPVRRQCRYTTVGCTYSDIFVKTTKHEWYTCAFSNLCFVCLRTVAGPMIVHRNLYHADVTRTSGTAFRFPTDIGEMSYIILGALGIFYCSYLAQPHGYELRVFSSLPSDHLVQYECVLEFINSRKRFSVKKYALVNYAGSCDWFLEIGRETVTEMIEEPDYLRIDIYRRHNII